MTMPEFALDGERVAEIAPGVYRDREGTPLAAVLTQLGQDGWATAVVDLTGTADKDSVMGAFADALEFPAWFGRNWDALEDLLRDFGWWSSGSRGRLIAVRGEPADGEGDRAVRETLLDVLESAVTYWAPTSTPLVVLLHG